MVFSWLVMLFPGSSGILWCWYFQVLGNHMLTSGDGISNGCDGVAHPIIGLQALGPHQAKARGCVRQTNLWRGKISCHWLLGNGFSFHPIG